MFDPTALFEFPELALKVMRHGVMLGYDGSKAQQNKHLLVHGATSAQAMRTLRGLLVAEKTEQKFLQEGGSDVFPEVSGVEFLSPTDVQGITDRNNFLYRQGDANTHGQLEVTSKEPTITKLQKLPKPVAIALTVRHLVKFQVNQDAAVENWSTDLNVSECFLYFAALGVHPNVFCGDFLSTKMPHFQNIPQFRELIAQGYDENSIREFITQLYYCFWDDNFPMDKPFLNPLDISNALSLLQESNLETEMPYYDVYFFEFPVAIYNEVVDPQPAPSKKEKKKNNQIPEIKANITGQECRKKPRYFSSTPATLHMRQDLIVDDGQGTPKIISRRKEHSCTSEHCLICSLKGYCGKTNIREPANKGYRVYSKK